MRRLAAALVFLLLSLSTVFAQQQWTIPYPVTTTGYMKLGQDTLPLVFPGQGSFANNGVVTGLPAVANTYAAAYIEVPANAIFSGSSAGLYYIVFSSSTAGTVYNNVYVSGTPTKPASPTPFVSTGPGAFTQPLTSLPSYQFIINGGVLGPNDYIELKGITSQTSSATAKTLRPFFGASQFGLVAITTSIDYGFDWAFVGRGATNSQVSALGSNGSFGVSNTQVYYLSTDTTVQNSVVLNVQLAAATDVLVLESCQLSIQQGVQ